jgi:hypothetical protein
LSKANKYIVGIYNYCDYWCERCAFTKRCRNFVTDRELELEMAAADTTKREPDDATNADFWKHIANKARESAIFGKADNWRDSIPDEDDFEIDPAWQAREDAMSEAVRAHPLVRMAYDYRARTAQWLKTADSDLKEVARSLLDAAGSQFDSNDYETQAREIGEMLDVVSWYHTLIAAKTARAVRGQLEHATPDPDLLPMIAGFRLEDANGSAKLVLMSIERSIGAWLRLREILPGQEDSILGLLALLDRMQRGVHAALPGAKAFFRPGFDGEPQEDVPTV